MNTLLRSLISSQRKINTKIQDMEPNEFDIERAAGLIIERDGINALTVDALELLMGIPKNRFSPYFNNSDEILEFMALKLELEIRQLIHGSEIMKTEPAQELTNLFKSLYDFFSRKSYFLELMFSDLVYKNDSASQVILLRIRKAVGNHLTQIIEQGKKKGVFNHYRSTKYEVKNILNRFRFFMSDIPLTHKMIRDLKKFKEKRE